MVARSMEYDIKHLYKGIFKGVGVYLKFYDTKKINICKKLYFKKRDEYKIN